MSKPNDEIERLRERVRLLEEDRDEWKHLADIRSKALWGYVRAAQPKQEEAKLSERVTPVDGG